MQNASVSFKFCCSAMLFFLLSSMALIAVGCRLRHGKKWTKLDIMKTKVACRKGIKLSAAASSQEHAVYSLYMEAIALSSARYSWSSPTPVHVDDFNAWQIQKPFTTKNASCETCRPSSWMESGKSCLGPLDVAAWRYSLPETARTKHVERSRWSLQVSAGVSSWIPPTRNFFSPRNFPPSTHQRPINHPSTPKMHSSTVPGHSVVTPSHGLLGFTTGPSRNMGDRWRPCDRRNKLGFKTQIWFASKCPSVTNAVTICAIPTGRNAETS